MLSLNEIEKVLSIVPVSMAKGMRILYDKGKGLGESSSFYFYQASPIKLEECPVKEL